MQKGRLMAEKESCELVVYEVIGASGVKAFSKIGEVVTLQIGPRWHSGG